MIKNAHLLLELEKDFMLQEKLSIEQKFIQYDELWKECITINKKLKKDNLNIKDSILELARILNSCSKK